MDGKVVVITGASSGFGKGAALQFAQLGATVVVAARRDYLLDELVAACITLGGSALAVPTDVSVLEDVEFLAQTTIERFGGFHVWINNAGAAALGLFTDVPLKEHKQVVETDLNGTIYGSYFAMRVFREQGAGTLINIASMVGKIPSPYYAAYSAAKHGVVGLSAALRQEVQLKNEENIHVCTVLPMAMDTPFFQHAANYTGHEAVPIPPLNDAQDVIEAIVDLAFNPKDEVKVGKGSGVFAVSDALLPGATEAMMAKNTHNAQIVEAPPAPPTRGNLAHPDTSGTGVHSDNVQR